MGARDLMDTLAGLGIVIAAEGGRLLIRPASRLTDALRADLRAFKPEVLALLGGGASVPGRPEPAQGPRPWLEAWTDDDIQRFTQRRAHLIRWGWPETDAELLAERLVIRERSGDDRTSCGECQHHRPGRCGNHRVAGLQSPDVGHDLAAMLQRCPGHQMTR
ncbi:MAG: hypothetical protein KBC73_12400 [Burkholderiaceae bacterium]|nr:hypothetical protein [Burkholderiaceae bacterium]